MLQVYSESDTFFNQLVGRRIVTALDLDGLFVPNGRFYVTLSVKGDEVQGCTSTPSTRRGWSHG